MIRALRTEVGALRSEVGELRAQVTTMKGDHAALKGDMLLNTQVTQQVYENTRTIIEAVESAASVWGFVSRWAGRFRRWTYSGAKWIAAVAIAFSATWAAAKAVFDVDLSRVVIQHWKDLR